MVNSGICEKGWMSSGVVAGIIISIVVVLAAVTEFIFCYMAHRKKTVSSDKGETLKKGFAQGKAHTKNVA